MLDNKYCQFETQLDSSDSEVENDLSSQDSWNKINDAAAKTQITQEYYCQQTAIIFAQMQKEDEKKIAYARQKGEERIAHQKKNEQIRHEKLRENRRYVAR